MLEATPSVQIDDISYTVLFPIWFANSVGWLLVDQTSQGVGSFIPAGGKFGFVVQLKIAHLGFEFVVWRAVEHNMG